jgi:hypothetical protein
LAGIAHAAAGSRNAHPARDAVNLTVTTKVVNNGHGIAGPDAIHLTSV